MNQAAGKCMLAVPLKPIRKNMEDSENGVESEYKIEIELERRRRMHE